VLRLQSVAREAHCVWWTLAFFALGPVVAGVDPLTPPAAVPLPLLEDELLDELLLLEVPAVGMVRGSLAHRRTSNDNGT